MDKHAIKKYAVWARRELISRVSTKALQYGITEKDCGNPGDDSVNGTLLTAAQKKQRQALIAQIKEKGCQEVMEEVAYTWFNRFSALRFMEVNGYFPTHVRVFTDENNAFKPQIITEAIHLEMDGLDMEKVYAYKDADEKDELYKYLLITQCNALSPILPGMFQKIEDYTELLFPDNLLREGSAIEQMITLIPEDDWKDAVQIIGWLYQYYNAEKKDDVFAGLKKNVKITKENIPAATQLFTPDWIVRYMVENSLGRLWLEGHPNAELQGNWKYYLEEAEQELEVQTQLATIRKEYEGMKPEDIKCIDPCCGSGHILAYLFDVLVQIYEAYGYTTREAVSSIVENNLYGLDIDDRAAQLANFAVMMKARQYDRRFFSRGIQPHVYAIQESNHIQYDKEFGDFLLSEEHRATLRYLLVVFQDAKEYGSILNMKQRDYVGFLEAWRNCAEASLENIMMMGWYMAANTVVQLLANQAMLLSYKYDVVVTNPPYMGISNGNGKLVKYVLEYFPDSKPDLFSVFIEKCYMMLKQNGFQAMITQHSWMFLTTFAKLRQKFLHHDLVSLIHLGAHAFEEISGEVVQTVSFAFRKANIKKYCATFMRLVEYMNQNSKRDAFLEKKNVFLQKSSNFSLIPSSTYMYWASSDVLKLFENSKMADTYDVKSGLSTGDNELYVKNWYEISASKFSATSGKQQQGWIPYNKGGGVRKWYGMNVFVVYWGEDGEKIRETGKAVFRNSSYYFRDGLTWSGIASTGGTFRYSPENYLFDSNKGPMIFMTSHDLFYVLGMLNSVVAQKIISMLNPTISLQIGDILNIPFVEPASKNIKKPKLIVEENIGLSCLDWDSFETSWDFIRHPLVFFSKMKQEQLNSQFANSRIEKFDSLAWHFDNWKNECDDRFNQLKANEEELNRIFINIYGLADELTPEVEDRDVTVRKADLQRDIKSLISYAVGCMFGRYSLYNGGLLYAGGSGGNYGSLVEKIQDSLKASGQSMFPEIEFYPDKDNIIPICDDEYFDDDIVGRFVKFIQVVYGKETLDANLKFIADALGGKGQPKDVIRDYFINGFYADHLKIYHKRPIYWLFDSGKKNGFKALIYMHRYHADTIARIRTDYVHEQQGRYRTAIADLDSQIENASTSERVKLTKKLTALQAQTDEIFVYEEKIHHLADQMISIDLDDGVKKNYEIFSDVLAKIK